jgi:signal transduction histidine kinase
MASLIDLHSTNERVEIKWRKPASPITINADKLQVNRLFTNLIQNAIEASADKGKALIEVKQEIQDDHVIVSVQDNGMGIPLEKQDKIFTPNFTTKSSGTGLGLAICKGIVEKAQGKIWFTTEEGKDTTFYVQLPLPETTG